MAHDVKLGQLIEGQQYRDAIHVAVAPMIAAQNLEPGDHVGFVEPHSQAVGYSKDALGIVDPFLKVKVPKGSQFWLFLYPNSITSLRHDWTHPAFGASVASDMAADSRRWIEDWASSYGVGYEEIMGAAKAFIEHGDYFNRGELFEGEYVPDDFWRHYETVTGVKVGDRGSFFTCSC